MLVYPARQVFAYGVLSTFLVFVLFYGFADSLSKMDFMDGSSKSWGILNGVELQRPKISFPELSYYKLLRTLTPNEFPIDDPTKRVLIVGDIHGQMTYLEKLLKKLKYSPSQDVLFHVGDIVSKGPLEGSLAVLHFMASNNITGVRGNHDQLVVEWRNWYNWVLNCPGGKEWLDGLQARWERAQSKDPDTELESWLKREKKASTRREKAWWKLIPKGWVILDDHYYVAKEMSEQHFQYLLDLPLRLYIPSAHTFIVHAGLLPCDPRYPVDDQARQPLARIPTLVRQPSGNRTGFNTTLPDDVDANSTSTSLMSNKGIDALRNLQETGILTQIPQNSDPWVIQNMRNVLSDGRISKQFGDGTPWSKLWKQHMQSCSGYRRFPQITRRDIDDDMDAAGNETTVDNSDDDEQGVKKYNLLCYPSTTVYGHAAGRGLDAKRWSFGLDTGCTYRRRLSALVIKGQTKGLNDVDPTEDNIIEKDDEDEDEDEKDDKDEDEDDEDEDEDNTDIAAKNKHKNKMKTTWLPFGDNHRAKVTSVRCKP